jgi:transcriptional regulator with XRE-family HTH domain
MATIEAVVHIGERLRRLRQERALRQEDLAKLAGIGKNTVNRIEKNRTEPHMTTIRKLADALKVEPAELVRGSESRLHTKSGEKGTQKNHHPAVLVVLDPIS